MPKKDELAKILVNLVKENTKEKENLNYTLAAILDFMKNAVDRYGKLESLEKMDRIKFVTVRDPDSKTNLVEVQVHVDKDESNPEEVEGRGQLKKDKKQVETPTPSAETVREILIKVDNNGNHREEAITLLKKFNANVFKELAKRDYKKFMKETEIILCERARNEEANQ